jgi:hypothetical protein
MRVLYRFDRRSRLRLKAQPAVVVLVLAALSAATEAAPATDPASESLLDDPAAIFLAQALAVQ